MLEKKVDSVPSQLRESFWHSRSIDMQKVLLPEVEGWKVQGFPRSEMTTKKTKEDWICNSIEFVSVGILPLQEKRLSCSVATNTIHKSNDTDVLIEVKLITRVMSHQLSREQTKNDIFFSSSFLKLHTFRTAPGWILLIRPHSTRPFLKQWRSSSSDGSKGKSERGPTIFWIHDAAWNLLEAEEHADNLLIFWFRVWVWISERKQHRLKYKTSFLRLPASFAFRDARVTSLRRSQVSRGPPV